MRVIDIETACSILLSKGVVAFPTETVYGLGADAADDAACTKIYKLKKRATTNPLIVHVRDLEHARQFGHMTPLAEKLAQKYWPGPMSIVVPSANRASSVALAGKKTICLRVPAHPVAQELLAQSGLAIAAPSANLSRMISATKSDHVAKYFDIPVIAEDGCVCGIESTIVDCTSDIPVILRDGFITEEDIEYSMDLHCKRAVNHGIAPGSEQKHYAPDCPLRMNATYASQMEVAVNFDDSRLHGAFSLVLGSDFVDAARNFYNVLHDAERLVRMHDLKGIAFAPIPFGGVGVALNDKLRRASAR